MAVVYLVFTEGYAATDGPDALLRPQSLGRGHPYRAAARDPAPARASPSRARLLALLLLHDSRRREARTDAHGNLVVLEDQDRTRWDRAKSPRASPASTRPCAWAPPGRLYVLQAAIAALARARRPARRRDRLAGANRRALRRPAPRRAFRRRWSSSTSPSPSRWSEGPAAGLARLDALEASGDLAGYHLLYATRADLLRRLGRSAEAADAYRSALDLAGSEAERRYLSKRLDEVSEPERAS